MQLKLGQQKQKLAVESEGSMSSKLASFQKFTDELVVKYGSGTQEPTSEVLEAVGQVLTFIGEMYDHLLLAHNNDMNYSASCTAVPDHLSRGAERCLDSFMSDTHIGEIRALENLSVESQQEHVACRRDAALKCQTLCASNNACKEYDRYRKEEEDALLPDCAKEGAFANKNIKADEGSPDLETMEDCLSPTKGWLDDLYGRYLNCTRVEDACTTKVDECDQAQTEFEARRCSYALLSDGHCNNFLGCCQEHCDNCDDECPRIQNRAGARAADNETGERLVCLLHTLFGQPVFGQPDEWTPPPKAEERPGKLDECKNKVIDVEGWKIDCTTGQACSDECSGSLDSTLCPTEGVNKPCDEAFIVELSEHNEFRLDTGFNDKHCPEKAQRGEMKAILPCSDAHDQCKDV